MALNQMEISALPLSFFKVRLLKIPKPVSLFTHLPVIMRKPEKLPQLLFSGGNSKPSPWSPTESAKGNPKAAQHPRQGVRTRAQHLRGLLLCHLLSWRIQSSSAETPGFPAVGARHTPLSVLRPTLSHKAGWKSDKGGRRAGEGVLMALCRTRRRLTSPGPPCHSCPDPGPFCFAPASPFDLGEASRFPHPEIAT